MSDPGETEESERLSDLDEIAEALRAGELDAETRFDRKRTNGNTVNNEDDENRPPDKILTDLRSEEETAYTYKKDVRYEIGSGYLLAVEVNPEDADIVVHVEDEEPDVSEVTRYIAQNLVPDTDDAITVKIIVEPRGEVYGNILFPDETTEIEGKSADFAASNRWYGH